MATTQTWLNPSKAANLVQHAREDGVTALGYGLLRSARTNITTLDLAFAKLNPIEPGPTSPHTRCGWPTTARDHRLLLAPGVADPVSIERLFGDYDLATPEHQDVLAAVFTIAFDRDRPLHDSFDAVIAWAMLDLARDRHLTCLAVLHAVNDQLSNLQQHAHILTLCRRHHASGWAAVHDDLNEDAHALWADRWLSFEAAWRRKPE